MAHFEAIYPRIFLAEAYFLNQPHTMHPGTDPVGPVCKDNETTKQGDNELFQAKNLITFNTFSLVCKVPKQEDAGL